MGIASNIVKVYPNKEPFWGKYNDLNSVIIPSTDEIRQYQLAKLKAFQKAALKNQNNNEITQRINTLFKQGAGKAMVTDYSNGEEISLTDALTKIANMFTGLQSYRYHVSGGVSEQQYKNINGICKGITKQLNILQQSLNINSVVYEQELRKVLDLMNAAEQQSLSAEDIKAWYYKINKIKGNLLEEIGTAWLNNLKVPNIQTINTGSIYLHTNNSNRHSGQLIQDLMTLSIDNIDLLNSVTLTYKTPNGDNMTTSLQEFLNILESASGSSKQIVIEDEAYDTLLSLSALNVQAKSGKNQLPWNKTSQINQVSIGEYGRDNLPLTVKRTFTLLHSLDNEKPKDIWVKDNSKDYNALANYGLATVLVKVMHLEANEGNQYLLTPSGFITYTERLEQLFSLSNGIAELVGGVSINEDTLNTKYQVKIKGLQY